MSIRDVAAVILDSNVFRPLNIVDIDRAIGGPLRKPGDAAPSHRFRFQCSSDVSCHCIEPGCKGGPAHHTIEGRPRTHGGLERLIKRGLEALMSAKVFKGPEAQWESRHVTNK